MALMYSPQKVSLLDVIERESRTILCNNIPLHSTRFPDGTEVTFNCIANTIGEKTTWTILCKHGSWLGHRSLSPCPDTPPHDTTHLGAGNEGGVSEGEDGGWGEERAGDGGDYGNVSCVWRNRDNVATFNGDTQIEGRGVVHLPPGTELVSPFCIINMLLFILYVGERHTEYSLVY